MTAVPGALPIAPARPFTPGSALRLVLVPAWTAFMLALHFGTRVIPGGERLRRRLVRNWARGVTRILRIRVVRTGSAPKAPFLLVSNHLSYLDIVVLAGELDAVFVAKREVAGWPLFGLGARAIGTIFVDRDSRRDAVAVATAMQARYEAGTSVVLFGEGTSTNGTTVLPLRTPLLEWPARTGLPVYTATLSYHTGPQDPPANDALCWWGDMTFLPHLAVVARLGPSEARVVFGPVPVTGRDRKMLARELHASLLVGFEPSGRR